MSQVSKTVLFLGANSDVAKQCILLYARQGFSIIACSQNLDSLRGFASANNILPAQISIKHFDATDFNSHQSFYDDLPVKPHIVIYAAGFLSQNEEARKNFNDVFEMMKVNYAGAVSILNIIAEDKSNANLERIIGLSSLSGVRERKSNYIYGSTKAAFATYFAGLRQDLSLRNIAVNVLGSGYIRTKINTGLKLNESLIMEPDYVAKHIVNAGNSFTIVPNWKWKIIYWLLKLSPGSLVAKMP